MQDKFLTKLGSVIELILEQYGFEQHVSTYMQIFSINKYYSTTQSTVG